MTVQKLAELLQPHSSDEAEIQIVVWDEQNQQDKVVAVERVRIVFDASGALHAIQLEAA